MSLRPILVNGRVPDHREIHEAGPWTQISLVACKPRRCGLMRTGWLSDCSAPALRKIGSTWISDITAPEWVQQDAGWQMREHAPSAAERHPGSPAIHQRKFQGYVQKKRGRETTFKLTRFMPGRKLDDKLKRVSCTALHAGGVGKDSSWRQPVILAVLDLKPDVSLCKRPRRICQEICFHFGAQLCDLCGIPVTWL